MADVSKRSAKVNLTGIYGNMAFGPLGLAVMSVNGHSVNPLSDVLMSGQARQTMFQPLKQQGSYEVTYNVTTGELENADTVEAQNAPMFDGTDPMDQYEEDVADYDLDEGALARALARETGRYALPEQPSAPPPPPDDQGPPDEGPMDPRNLIRALTRSRKDLEMERDESRRKGISKIERAQIDREIGITNRSIARERARLEREREARGPIPIPENIQNMPSFTRSQARAEQRAAMRERQFAALMSSRQRFQRSDRTPAERQQLVNQRRQAQQAALQAVSENVSYNVDNDNRLLAQVSRAEDGSQALGSENSSIQSQRVQAPEAIIYRPFVNPLVPIIEDRDIRQTAGYQAELQQSRQQQIASNRMEDYIIALDEYRRGNRPVPPRDPRVNESSGTRLDPRIIQRQQFGAADIEFHESGYHRNPQEINEASPEQVESYLQMQRMAQNDNASFEIQNAFGRFTTALISRAIVGNRRQNQQEPRSRIQDEARMQRNLEAANILTRFRDERGYFPDDTRVLQILETTINRYRQHQAMPGIRGMNELVRLYGEFVDAYNAEREQQRQNLRTVAQRNQAIDDNNDLLLGRNPYNPQEPD
jgi:hypothetical protein